MEWKAFARHDFALESAIAAEKQALALGMRAAQELGDRERGIQVPSRSPARKQDPHSPPSNSGPCWRTQRLRVRTGCSSARAMLRRTPSARRCETNDEPP